METAYPTVLIVEDEPIVRIYQRELAEGAGFPTLMASTAEEALCVLEGRSDVSILLTDVAMPGAIDGIELANIVRERWPNIGIVIASGHVDSEAGEEIVYVRKPFTARELIDALRSMV